MKSRLLASKKRGKEVLSILLTAAVMCCFALPLSAADSSAVGTAVIVPATAVSGYSVSEQFFSYTGTGSYNYRSGLTAREKLYYDFFTTMTPDMAISSTRAMQINWNIIANVTGSAGSVKIMDTTLTLAEFDFANNAAVISTAFRAFLLDYPEAFWINPNECRFAYVYSGSQAMMYIILAMHDDYSIGTNALAADLANMVQGIDKTGVTRYDTLKSIHDDLCRKLTYDYSLTDPTVFNPYGALSTGNSVCEGYAEAFKLACDAIGIPCVLMVGYGLSSQDYPNPNLASGLYNHMWNMVQMEDGKWYGVDVTWDDQEEYGIFYEFFLSGANTVAPSFDILTFAQSHIVDTGLFIVPGRNFGLPAMSATAYVPPAAKPGDADGDGFVTLVDLMAVRAHILGQTQLSGAMIERADIDGINGIGLYDLVWIRDELLGLHTA